MELAKDEIEILLKLIDEEITDLMRRQDYLKRLRSKMAMAVEL
jgi:hypothetical protein